MAQEDVAQAGADFLAHYGVKGMKWGVRNDRRGKLRRGATKANQALNTGAKVIKEGEKELIFLPFNKRQQAATNTQVRVLSSARAINKDPKFKGKDIKNDPELKKDYNKSVEKTAKKIYAEELGIARQEAIVEFVEAAVGGRRQERMNFKVDRSRIRHAEEENVFSLELVRDGLGHVSDIRVIEESMKQSDEADDYYLEHFGVKGMKWGVRRTRAERRAAREAPSGVTVTNKTRRSGSQDITVNNKAGQGVGKVKGGKRNLATDDAVKTAVVRQKAKKSTVDSLSNDELRTAVERMRLEQQYAQLEKNIPRRKRGSEFIKALLEQGAPLLEDVVKNK